MRFFCKTLWAFHWGLLFLFCISLALQAEDLASILRKEYQSHFKKLEAFDYSYLESIIPEEHRPNFLQSTDDQKKEVVEFMLKTMPRMDDLKYIHALESASEARYYFYENPDADHISAGFLRFEKTSQKWLPRGTESHLQRRSSNDSRLEAMKIFKNNERFHFEGFPSLE